MLTLPIPELETERLRLRAWREEDLAPFAAFCADEATARSLGGPCGPAEAWRRLSNQLGHWVLRGYGSWALEEKASGQWVGYSGLWNPQGWPEPEVMWGLAASAHGRGYATEAAKRARDFAYQELGWSTLISCIAPDNVAPQRVAKRLGAILERRSNSGEARPTSTAIHPRPFPTHDHPKENEGMALKIRLARAGAKKRPYYRIVVADSKSPRDGRYIERIGTYDPLLPKGSTVRVKFVEERVKHWLQHGAQPTDRVLRFLDAAGIRKREARSNPQKGQPGKKRLEREEAKKAAAEEKAKAAAEAAAAPPPAEEPAPEAAEPAAEPAAETDSAAEAEPA